MVNRFAFVVCLPNRTQKRAEIKSEMGESAKFATDKSKKCDNDIKHGQFVPHKANACSKLFFFCKCEIVLFRNLDL